MRQSSKPQFLKAFEQKDAKAVAEELKFLPGMPSSKFNILLHTAISTNDLETGLKAGVIAYPILRHIDITKLLSPKNGPSEKIALFVEIMRARHNGFSAEQLKYLFNALCSYSAKYKKYGNIIPKTWLSHYILDIYKYGRAGTIPRYLYMYSLKAPSDYEHRVAMFLSFIVKKEGQKILHCLAINRPSKEKTHYEALHALNSVSPQQAASLAKVILERQADSVIFYSVKTIEYARQLVAQHKP